jgi:quercetin dioxygenase-like cupin family protein
MKMTAERRRLRAPQPTFLVACENSLGPSVVPAAGGVLSTNRWQTGSAPADNTGDIFDGSAGIQPPPLGSVFRIIESPPTEQVVMHRTATLDYAIVLEGEIYAILDDGVEKLMQPGEVLIQRGTNHGWRNRSSGPSRVLFVSARC